MSLFRIFDTAGTALSAQTIRLNTTSSNMANADAVSSSINETYRSKHPVFRSVLMGENDAAGPLGYNIGVKVEDVLESQAPLRQEYSPDHPQANEDGFIFRSNVNMVEEMANMISASRSYQSNLEVMNTTKQLMLRTLSVGQG
jgi:flagellar basal-body rod protein FlgC